MKKDCGGECGHSQKTLTELFPQKKEALLAFMKELSLDPWEPEKNRGHLIESLHKAQEIFGYLPEDVQHLVARTLGIHLTEVYGVVSFYTYFTDKPKGEFQINVCTGTACFVKGAEDILEEFKRYLHINNGETTADMRYSLGSLRCVGACSLAPVVMVNDRIYGEVSTKQVPDIIADCKN